jgi:hypothetical protein
MNQFDGSNREKQNREIPGRIIQSGGADNPAPSKFFPKTCCSTQIDRSGEEDHTTWFMTEENNK